jgi:hypothetical protein
MRLWMIAVTVTLCSIDVSRAAPPESWAAVEIGDLGIKYDLLGRTHQPMGKVIVLQGVIVEGPFKGYEGGPNLQVQRISGVATQEAIRIPLVPMFGDFQRNDPVKIVRGKTVELQGYEAGEFVGVPSHVPVIFQTCGFYFKSEFRVIAGKPIPAIVFQPADYVDRKALVEGRASNFKGKPAIEANEWRVRIDGALWPDNLIGKEAEAIGVIRRDTDPTGRLFHLSGAKGRLVQLSDQLNRPVELRGTAWSRDGVWSFEYRGQEIYVDGMDDLPGWSSENHGGPMMIRGTLYRAKRPDLEQISLKANPDHGAASSSRAAMRSSTSHALADSMSEQIRKTSCTVPVPV